MEPGTHYLAKLELIIMFHGALRKFRSIVWTSTLRNEGDGERGSTSKNARAISKKNIQYMYRHSALFNIFQPYFLLVRTFKK